MFKPGDSIVGRSFLVESSQTSDTKKGTKFLRLVFRDKTETISGNLWDFDPAMHGFVKPGVVVQIIGSIESYQDKPQLKIQSISPSSEPIEKFARSTTLDPEMMWDAMVNRVGAMTEPMTKFILEELLIKAMAEGFKKAPAARGVHGAWYGGLMEHVYGMCILSDSIVAHYRSRYNAPISHDKVQFGLMAHDLGKTIEYDYSTPAFTSTPIGILTNHLVMGPAWIYEYANRFWATRSAAIGMTVEEFKLERAHLIHLVAAHHGQIDWGSPVVPSTLEAVLVHQIDMVDSKFMHALDFVQNKPGTVPGFSEKSFIAQTCFMVPSTK